MIFTSPTGDLAASGHTGRARAIAAISAELSPQSSLRWWFVGVLVCQALDGVSGAQMMQTRGLEAELNPLARSVFATTGWSGLLVFKAGVLSVTLPLLAWVARCGHVRMVRACLILAAGLGLLGWWSNGLP